ncbi:MAG: hypothetical protein WCA13_21060 [Terriglobales bacterium]
MKTLPKPKSGEPDWRRSENSSGVGGGGLSQSGKETPISLLNDLLYHPSIYER